MPLGLGLEKMAGNLGLKKEKIKERFRDERLGFSFFIVEKRTERKGVEEVEKSKRRSFE